MRTLKLLGVFGAVSCLVLAACNSDSEPGTPVDAGAGTGGGAGMDSSTDGAVVLEASTDDSASEAGEGGPSADAIVARGKYLVEHVAACVDCHTPRLPGGASDTTKYLAGSTTPFADLAPTDPASGNIYPRNLTPDMATGLGTWTKDEIKNAFLNGVSKDKTVLFPIMPYYVLHNMSADDAEAIASYLKSIPAIAQAIPADQPLPIPRVAVNPVPVAQIPQTTLAATDPNYARAVHGRYLAGQVGVCMECHTTHQAALDVLDLTKLFAGKEPFQSADLGLPSPPFPMTIFSANITPHANGIQAWTPEQVKTLLKTALDDEKQPICPPMPAGAMQAFGGLTDDDALDIGYYVTTIPPIDNGVIPHCVLPGAPPGDGGAEASSSEGGDAATTSDAATTNDAATEAATGDGAAE